MVLRYDVPALGNHRVHVSGDGTTLQQAQSAIVIRKDCDDGPEMACEHDANFDAVIGATGQETVHILLSGPFYASPFTVTITDTGTCFSDFQCGIQQSCEDDVCWQPQPCAPDHFECNGLLSDGCEGDLTSAANCGFCGNVCGDTHAAPLCHSTKGCVLTCDAGFADCNGVSADGCESELASDPFHCGSCPNDCQGSACVSGVCAAPPVVLATGAGADRALVMDATSLYVVWDDTLQRVPKDGGPVVELAALPDAFGSTRALAVAGNDVYVAPFGAVLRVDKDTGATQQVASPTSTHAMAVAGDHLYYTSNSELRRLQLPDGPEETVASEPDVLQGIASDGITLYWIAGPALRSRPLDMSAPAVTLTGVWEGFRGPQQFAWGGGFVFDVTSFPDASRRAPAILGASFTDFHPESASCYALHGGNVYFTDQTTLRTMPVAGNSPQVVLQAQLFGGRGMHCVAADASGVYVTRAKAWDGSTNVELLKL
jgi:hypothetical protein